MTIQGPGVATIAVDGAGNYQPFILNATSKVVTIAGITIQNGYALGGTGGGGINVIAGGLNLNVCKVSHNHADGETLLGDIIDFPNDVSPTPLGVIGAILTPNVFSMRFAGGNGGGIAIHSSATLTNCTFSDNYSFFYASGQIDSGGGIWCSGSAAMVDCAVTGNSASYGDGGGISSSGTLLATNCLVSGNSGEAALQFSGPLPGGDAPPFGFGGGIFNTGTAVLTSCSLSANTCDAGGGVASSGPLNVGLTVLFPATLPPSTAAAFSAQALPKLTGAL